MTRKTDALSGADREEVLLLLRAGISWRRLAYLLQIPEATCRRAISADAELAAAKRPEGWAAEIALARAWNAIDPADVDAVRKWTLARGAYDTNRAKNAYYRKQARQVLATEQQQSINKEIDRLSPMPEDNTMRVLCPDVADARDKRIKLRA